MTQLEHPIDWTVAENWLRSRWTIGGGTNNAAT
jgi:hypothetical protein